MTRRQARRARELAVSNLQYRAWSTDPGTAPLPSIAVISDPRLHAREAARRLRRAQNGVFDSPPSVRPVTV